MEPIIALTTTSTWAQPNQPQQLRDVSSLEEQRFSEALNSTPIGEPDAATLVDQDGQELVEQTSQVSSQSLGGAFIDGIEGIKSTLDARAERIKVQLVELGNNPMSLQDAMRMQFELMQMGMQQELTSKMADKTSQGVQMLFRNQG